MVLSSTFSGSLEFYLRSIGCQERVPEPILLPRLLCASSRFPSPFPASAMVSVLDTRMLHPWRELRSRNCGKATVPRG